MRLTPFEVAQPCSEIETARPRKLIRVSAALSVVPLTLSIHLICFITPYFSKNSCTSLYGIILRPSLIGKSLPFPSNDPASPGSSTVRAPFPPYAMLPRRRPTTLRACGVFARRSLPVVPSSPLAVWAGCPSLLRSVRLRNKCS